MSTVTRTRRQSASASTIADAVDSVIAQAPPIPPAPIPLAQQSGANILASLQSYASNIYSGAVSALLVACAGSVDKVLALLGDDSPLIPHVWIASQVVSVLNKTAPRELFGADYANTSGIRIGDLHASALGLGALYRASVKGELKIARTHAVTLRAK